MIYAQASIKWFEEFIQLSNDDKHLKSAKAEIDKLKKIREQFKMPEGQRTFRYDELIARANVFLEMELLKEAVSTAASAAELDPNRWDAYAITASALYMQEQWHQAADFLQLAIKYAPTT